MFGNLEKRRFVLVARLIGALWLISGFGMIAFGVMMIVFVVRGVFPGSLRSSVAFLCSGIVGVVAGFCILNSAVGRTATTRSVVVLWGAGCFVVWSMGKDAGHPILIASIGTVSMSLALGLVLWLVSRVEDR